MGRGLVAALEGKERGRLLVHVHRGDPVPLGLERRQQIVLAGAGGLVALDVGADGVHQTGDHRAEGARIPRTIPIGVNGRRQVLQPREGQGVGVVAGAGWRNRRGAFACAPR